MNDHTTSGPGRLEVGEAPHLDQLTLPALRAYRQHLRDEEDRASYWRRLVHARLDLIEAGGRSGPASGIRLDDLVRVLGDTATGASRTALLRVRAADPLPELPDLAGVWRLPASAEETAEVAERLRAAERQLTAYRSALFSRIDESTAALVDRYREDPTAALAVLDPGAA